MRIFAPSVLVGVALIFGAGAGFAQEQPAAGAPPPGASSQAPAQDTQTPPPAPDMQGAPMPARNPQRQARMLAKKLALTPDQESQIEPILADRIQRTQSLRADSTLTPRDRRARARGIAEDADGKINAILNDTQKQQYAQLKQEMKEKRQERKQQMQQGDTAAPPNGE
jgi:hypothetical protein